METCFIFENYLCNTGTTSQMLWPGGAGYPPSWGSSRCCRFGLRSSGLGKFRRLGIFRNRFWSWSTARKKRLRFCALKARANEKKKKFVFRKFKSFFYFLYFFRKFDLNCDIILKALRNKLLLTANIIWITYIRVH